MDAKKKDTRFSSAWTDKDGKPKEGVKVRDLKSKKKPFGTTKPSEPTEATEPNVEDSLFSSKSTRRGEK